MAEATKAITVLDATLTWGKSASALTKKIKITGIPATGGTPNDVDVSTTEDPIEVLIDGRISIGTLEFDYFYDKDGENHQAVLADAEEPLFYSINLKGGDAGTITWEGTHTAYLQEAEGDDPIKGKLVVRAFTKPLVNKPTAVGV